MNGRPKSHRALIHAAEFVEYPDIDAVDTMLLTCIAVDATSEMGKGSRPGNVALQRAAKLGWSATHARLEKLIRLGLIERTETPKGGRGNRHAAVYRICWEHPAYPDYSPNGEECYLLEPPDPDKPSGDGRTLSGETIRPESGNHPVSGAKPSGETAKPSGPEPDHILIPTKDQPTPQPNPKLAGRLDGWLSSLEPPMNGTIPNKKERHELEKLVDQINAKGKDGIGLLKRAVAKFEKRDKGLDGLDHPWLLFLEEAKILINRIHKEDEEKKRRDDAAARAIAADNEERRRLFGGLLKEPSPQPGGPEDYGVEVEPTQELSGFEKILGRALKK